MKVKEVIIVEGKYDKIAVKSAVDAVVFETSGFGIFSDSEKMDLICRLAEKRGIIVLTDSDGAGLVIRNYIKGAVPCGVKQAYIPDIYGKEKRKSGPSGEGKLGVEGMKKSVIIDALKNAGATFEENDGHRSGGGITKGDFYFLGLSGKSDSALRRKALLKELSLPENLSANALLDVINLIFGKDEFYLFLEKSSIIPAPSVDTSSTL